MLRRRCHFPQRQVRIEEFRSKNNSGLSIIIFGTILLCLGLCSWFFTTYYGKDNSRSIFGNLRNDDSTHMKIMQSVSLVMIVLGSGLLVAGIVAALCGAIKSKHKDAPTDDATSTPYTIDIEERHKQLAQRNVSNQSDQPPPSYQMALDHQTSTIQDPILSGYQTRAQFENNWPPSAPPSDHGSNQLMTQVANGPVFEPYHRDVFSGRPIYRQLEPLTINTTAPSNIFTVSGQPHFSVNSSVQILPGQFNPAFEEITKENESVVQIEERNNNAKKF